MLLTAGDKEISAALASGMLAARLPMANSLSQPTADSSLKEGALTKEQREAVSAEIDRQKIADYLRVAMHREPVDYAALAFDAEMRYGESVYEPGPLKRAAEKMLVGWALICLGFHELFRSVGTEERT